MNTFCAHILYSGTVQGVGFRYAVMQYASSCGVTGWVKNLRSGQVEALVEGTREEIEALCARIEERFDGYISDKEIVFKQVDACYNDFRIM